MPTYRFVLVNRAYLTRFVVADDLAEAFQKASQGDLHKIGEGFEDGGPDPDYEEDLELLLEDFSEEEKELAYQKCVNNEFISVRSVEIVPDPPVVQNLICPSCGAAGPFRLLGRIHNYRDVWGFKPTEGEKSAALYVEGRYETGEGYDSTDEYSIECHANLKGRDQECCHVFSVPDGIEILFEEIPDVEHAIPRL